MRIKVFYEVNNPDGLEARINEWLKTSGAIVTKVRQSQSGRLDCHITITLFYEN